MTEQQTAPVAWCFKCRSKQPIVPVGAPLALKSGGVGQHGTCATCGAKVYRIGKVS